MIPHRSFMKLLHIRRNGIQFRNVSKVIKEIDVNKIRNIGIIAHIDAGKTTTTERMLYYSGFSHTMGEVHKGDTIMDYMPQERERGITITSAAITFFWNKHKLNLIDTPGHVDFTFEVERSLSVLDGAILILDASAGVEVQTLKVWEQANRYKIPCILYLNKMDKPTADIEMCLKSISNKLKAKTLLLHTPQYTSGEKKFCGVIDLIKLKSHLWDKRVSDDGRLYTTNDISTENQCNLPSVLKERERLIENIAELDDEIAEKYITGGASVLSVEDLQSALRKITLEKTAIPILCGSSYKNVAVQLLMNAVLDYLPSPNERTQEFSQSDLCALVFKIIHNKNKDSLTFLRIYSGTLKNNSRIFNMNRNSSEKIAKLMVPLADEFQESSSLSAGNIAAVAGLKDAVTGDVLFSTAAVAEKFNSSGNAHKIPIIQILDPVFFCTIEPPSVGFQNKLEFALQCLQREDPTFQVEFDESIGQTILMGMGELHIEVIKERIRTEFGVDAFLGPIQVAYKESISKLVEHTHIVDKTIGGINQFAKITTKIYPSSEPFLKRINVIVDKENDLGKLRTDHLKAINNGVKSALSNGPMLSFPVINIAVDLLWFETTKNTSLNIITAATTQCITAALRKSKVHLLEPIMNLSIVADEKYTGRVLSDLNQKRSQIQNMELRQNVQVISAKTPLSELKGYSTHLRALTSGNCTFTMDFDSYQKMEASEQSRTIESVTGFSSS